MNLFSKIKKDSRGKPGWLELDQMRKDRHYAYLVAEKACGGLIVYSVLQ